MGAPVVHWEFWSENPGQAGEFYSTVFGWQVHKIPHMAYRLDETGGSGGNNGGIMTPQKGPWPGKLTFYIDVDDLDAYTKKIEAAGGKIVVPKMEVPGVGWMLLFCDPDERIIGLWKQNKS